MSSLRESDEAKSYEKLARLYHHGFPRRDVEYRFEQLLELEGDINYRVPESSCLRLYKPNCVGNTILHFSADRRYPEVAQLLLDHGADPTVKNSKGETAVHRVVREIYSRSAHRNPFTTTGKLDSPYVRVQLTAQVRRENATNPRDPRGFSHFHAACMADDVEVVEFFLNNRVPIDEAVDADSALFPGYTPLHFAVRFGCVEVARLLVSRGANLTLKDSRSTTALHLAVERKIAIVRHANARLHRETDGKSDALTKVRDCESIIVSILSKMDESTIDSLDLYPFYAMHASKNELPADVDVNETIDATSSFRPGYTALHFAAHFDADTFKSLLDRGADVEAKDANGDTPLDLCVGAYDLRDIHDILRRNVAWREILLSDGNTKLVDLVRSMRDTREFASFVRGLRLHINDILIPADSPLWPGSTILHLVVILSKRCICTDAYDTRLFAPIDDGIRRNELLELCLRFGSDVTAQDRHGSTPLHLAFRRLDANAIDPLLRHRKALVNPVDADNVSHLHVACAMSSEQSAKRLIDAGAHVNGAVSSGFRWEAEVQAELQTNFERYFVVCAGSTPLHVAVEVGSEAIVKALMDAGADVTAKNVHGFTPLHLLFASTRLKRCIGEIFMSASLAEDCVVRGLSYLHVAARGQCPKAVEKLLDLGADVNATISVAASASGSGKFEEHHDFATEMSRSTSKMSYLLSASEGDTPLHTAFDDRLANVSVPLVLLTRGADVFAENARGARPICDVLTKDYVLRRYAASAMSDADEARLRDDMGLTRLHVACKLRDETMIRECVANGMNVNARVRDDSRIWPGYTALHVLVASYRDDDERDKTICRITRFLLRNGADVTIASANGETPLLMNIWDNHIDERPAHMDILMRSLRDTVVNCVSAQGVSHFHVACARNDVALATKLLKLGAADVNETVDYFSSECPGFTALHFAACRRCDSPRSDLPPLRTIHLLLKHGADVRATDATDDTPLHVAARYVSLFKLPYRRILWAGADPEVKNIYGTAPPAELIQFTGEEECRDVCGVCLFACGYPIRELRSAIRRCFRGRANKRERTPLHPLTE